MRRVRKSPRVPIHYVHQYGVTLCHQNLAPGQCTDDPLRVSCGECREQLAKMGIQTTKTHFPAATGVLCKIQNDTKRVSDIVVVTEIDSVTCGNCKRIARDRGLMRPKVVSTTGEARC